MTATWKARVDKFLTIKYAYLLECATNITRRMKTDENDLVAELVLFLYDNEEKLELYNHDDTSLTAFSVSWLKLQATYDSTPFNRKYKCRSNEGEGPEPAEAPAPLPENEYITDLRRVYNDEQVENILKIHDIYPQLSKVQQTLFQAYFMDGLSYDKIKDRYDFFRTDANGKRKFYKSKKSIYNLMNDLKEEIRRRL